MIVVIEQPEVLKSWMVKMLKPLCDAEPSKLAKYVMALIKKDVPYDQLRASTIRNLEIFLHEQAEPFVDKLLTALSSRSYLESSAMLCTTESNQEVVDKSDNFANIGCPITVAVTHSEVVALEKTSTQSMQPLLHEMGDAVQSRRKQFSSGISGERPHVRGSSPGGVQRHQRGAEDRKREERRRRSPHRDSDVRRRSPQQHSKRYRRSRSPARMRSRSPRVRSRSPRVRSRSPRVRSRSPRVRSRSPPKIKSRSPLRPRHSNSYIPSESTHHQSVASLNEVSRDAGISCISTTSAATHNDKQQAGDDQTVVSKSMTSVDTFNGTPVQAVSDTRTKILSKKQRCSDFDEKGFCLAGDQCPFDHGLDPVVLKDVPLPEMLKFQQVVSATSNRSVPFAPLVQHAAGPAGLHAPSVSQPLAPPVCPPASLIMSNTECYNPDAPSITPCPDYTQLHDGPPSFMYPPAAADSNFFHPQLMNNRRVILTGAGDPMTSMLRNPSFPRPRRFDFKRLGPRGGYIGREVTAISAEKAEENRQLLQAKRAKNCSLQVHKVPASLNQIFSLNKHFSKFGKILNIQISYNGDPTSALITYSQPSEAKSAYKSTEAVLNNRFIKVYWHDLDSAENSENNQTSSKESTDADNNKNDENTSCSNETLDEKMSEIDKNIKDEKRSSIEAIQRSQQILAAKLSLNAKTKQKEKEALRLSQNLRKRESELLEKQIAQQKALLARLEDPNLNEESKNILVKTIGDLQKAILSTSSTITSALSQISLDKSPSQASARAMQKQAHKQLLDVEMELYTRQKAGSDTTELQKRLLVLRNQIKQFSSCSRFRGRALKGSRGRGILRSNRNPHMRLTSLDNRSRQLRVYGYASDQKTKVLVLMNKFGDIIARKEVGEVCMMLEYKNRKQAEMAYKSRDEVLKEIPEMKVDWVDCEEISAENSAQSDSANASKSPSYGVLENELDYEEETEWVDEGERSWRK